MGTSSRAPARRCHQAAGPDRRTSGERGIHPPPRRGHRPAGERRLPGQAPRRRPRSPRAPSWSRRTGRSRRARPGGAAAQRHAREEPGAGGGAGVRHGPEPCRQAEARAQASEARIASAGREPPVRAGQPREHGDPCAFHRHRAPEGSGDRRGGRPVRGRRPHPRRGRDDGRPHDARGRGRRQRGVHRARAENRARRGSRSTPTPTPRSGARSGRWSRPPIGSAPQCR